MLCALTELPVLAHAQKLREFKSITGQLGALINAVPVFVGHKIKSDIDFYLTLGCGTVTGLLSEQSNVLQLHAHPNSSQDPGVN